VRAPAGRRGQPLPPAALDGGAPADPADLLAALDEYDGPEEPAAALPMPVVAGAQALPAGLRPVLTLQSRVYQAEALPTRPTRRRGAGLTDGHQAAPASRARRSSPRMITSRPNSKSPASCSSLSVP
jgi:hypothetical protein